MSYIDTRLSTCVAYGFSGGPEYNTLLIPRLNGREQRNGQWLYPKHKYTAQYMNLPAAARDELLAAFHAARGKLHAFRFKDWNDYRAVAEPLSPSIGTSTPLQLVKTYMLGAQPTVRLIQAPVSGAVVKKDGSPVAGALDTGTGLFTPTDPWGAGTYTWDGQFDVWVRFDSDYNAFAIGNWDAHTADIDLVEVRR